MGKVAVLYLSWWKNHKQWSGAFLDSISSHAPGANFDLLYLLKEFPEDGSDPAFEKLRDRLNFPLHVVRSADRRFDLNVYLEIAAAHDYDRFLFLNSYSRVLAPNWLSSYLSAFDSRANAGIVAATGSYETMPGLAFPNVHVRTNGFMIDRSLLLRIKPGPLETKRDTNRLEAGADNLTQQIVGQGRVPLVVDRFARAWQVDDWPISRTFRSGRQEGLLIADNRTHNYEVGSAGKRRKLAHLAWGDRAMVAPENAAARALSHLAWKWPAVVQPVWRYG